MRFTPIVPLLALAASANANAAISASQITSNIDKITQLSSDTNEIAKSVSVTNVFSQVPQLISSFRQIIYTVTNDIDAMNSKRSLEARQKCLDDIEKCLEDHGEDFVDPAEILGKKGQAAPTYSDTEQQAICKSIQMLVKVNEALLDTLIIKHDILSLTPSPKPVAATLRIMEDIFGTLAIDITDIVPTCIQNVTQNMDSLNSTLGDAINEYSD